MFNFIGFIFSLLKGIYNTCAIHTQVNKEASVAGILFAGLLGIFSTSINKILLDAQIKEYNTKLSTRPNTYDEDHRDTNTTPTAPQLPNLPQNHPLSLVPRNFRNLAITNPPNFIPNTVQSPIQHIVTQHNKMMIHMNKLLNNPTSPLFNLKIIIFLTHDEQTNWIPPPLKLPSSQPPNSNPHYPSFCFSATRFTTN